jgi:hypothetical protein
MDGPLFTECVEPIFSQHDLILRTALIGVGSPPRQTPVIVFDPSPAVLTAFENFEDSNGRAISRDEAIRELPGELAELAKENGLGMIQHFLRRDNLPVDVRHNAKINREELAVWAAKQLQSTPGVDDPRPLAGS